jgi:hypothetical protein
MHQIGISLRSMLTGDEYVSPHVTKNEGFKRNG